jgi:hypothetical protein
VVVIILKCSLRFRRKRTQPGTPSPAHRFQPIHLPALNAQAASPPGLAPEQLAVVDMIDFSSKVQRGRAPSPGGRRWSICF